MSPRLHKDCQGVAGNALRMRSRANLHKVRCCSKKAARMYLHTGAVSLVNTLQRGCLLVVIYTYPCVHKCRRCSSGRQASIQILQRASKNEHS